MTTVPIDPPFASRGRTRPVTTIVLHATAGTSLAGAVSTLRDRGLGYHYLIERNGTVHKGCATSRNCGHAGVSEGPDGAHANGYSIGVAFVHPNNGSAISEAAIQSVKELCKELADAIPSIEWLTTHYAITVKPNGSYRKSDPRNCPVEAIASYAGLKPWRPSYATRYSL